MNPNPGLLIPNQQPSILGSQITVTSPIITSASGVVPSSGVLLPPQPQQQRWEGVPSLTLSGSSPYPYTPSSTSQGSQGGVLLHPGGPSQYTTPGQGMTHPNNTNNNAVTINQVGIPSQNNSLYSPRGPPPPPPPHNLQGGYRGGSTIPYGQPQPYQQYQPSHLPGHGSMPPPNNNINNSRNGPPAFYM